MSTFPSVLSTISNPASTNKLSNPSHSSIESAQNDAIQKLETFIGTLSSAVGTIMYDIRAAASDGGGHVQVANKGGTGQTAFTKGDIIVATSSSVLSKLAVGSDTQALVADSNQAAGVKWGGVATATNIQNQTYTYVRASVMSGSVYGVVLSQNPSILSDGLGLIIKFPAAPTSSVMALQVFTSSSGSVAARIKKTNSNNPDTTDIVASMIGVLEFDSVSSVFQMVNLGGGGVTAKTMTQSRDSSLTTTLTIAHGLGRIPNVVFFKAISQTGGQIAVGDYDGTTQAGGTLTNVGSNTVFSSTSAIVLGDTTTSYNLGVISVDATNITITWTKTGTPTKIWDMVFTVS